jgi:CreA protein
MPVMRRIAALGLALAFASSAALAAEPVETRIGDVSTTFRVLGRNDKIIVDRYDDPAVNNVSCYVSRAETGGIAGSLGLATDPSRFSIACRATGAASLKGTVPDNEVVFGASANWAFKEIRVSRIVDRQRNVLVYLVWSTQALSKGGSPYNSVSAVPLDAH